MLEIPIFHFCCSLALTQPTRLTTSTNDDDRGRGAVAEDGSPINEAGLVAIPKDPRSKAALLKKMGLGDEANKDHHPTSSGTNTGGWPPYPLGSLGWPGFIPPFPYESAAPRAPTWREGRGPESQWAGLRYKPPDEAEEAGSNHTEELGPGSK